VLFKEVLGPSIIGFGLMVVQVSSKAVCRGTLYLGIRRLRVVVRALGLFLEQVMGKVHMTEPVLSSSGTSEQLSWTSTA
jgi:hypothetical protein